MEVTFIGQRVATNVVVNLQGSKSSQISSPIPFGCTVFLIKTSHTYQKFTARFLRSFEPLLGNDCTSCHQNAGMYNISPSSIVQFSGNVSANLGNL